LFPPSELSVIQVSNLRVQYGGVVALDDVSLHFRDGESTVLLGRSGAGKSTLLRCLNLLQRPSRGEVEVEGIGALSDRRHLRRHRLQTGSVFQFHHLIGTQTALENVVAGRLGRYSLLRSLFPFPRADVHLALDCLEQVGLLHKARERADRLSGGERQRVGIARALCQQPTTILADEPIASLDPATAQELMALLCRTCRDSGLTLIMSLHQMDMAMRHGDRIIGLAGGKVVYDGPPKAITDADIRAIYGDEAIVWRPNTDPVW
jgi:phosphonate transport system ATP-binding protein